MMKAKPDEKLVQLKSLETLKEVANGEDECCCDGQMSGDYLVYGLFQLLYFFFRGAGGKTVVQLAFLPFYVC